MSIITSESKSVRFCSDCTKRGMCVLNKDKCSRYSPPEAQTFMNTIMPRLLAKNIPAKTRTWSTLDLERDIENDTPSLEFYYRNFINDCLDIIRSEQVAYVFEIDHIKDILRFIPDVQVAESNGIFYVYQTRRATAC